MKAKYALRALLILAQHSGQLIGSRQIADEGDIPHKFLEAILAELKQNRVVESRRGTLGGYTLTRSPAHIAAGDIIRIIDGPLAPIRCASVTAYAPCEDCPDVAACSIRKMMLRVRHAIADVLDHTSLHDMLQSANTRHLLETA
jgi:Rrf2 family protein